MEIRTGVAPMAKADSECRLRPDTYEFTVQWRAGRLEFDPAKTVAAGAKPGSHAIGGRKQQHEREAI
jgi:hypothetical protein